jgi:ankyrin repeat protein
MLIYSGNPFFVSGHVDVAILLLSTGADMRVVNLNGSTPFHFAASAGKREVCRVLIEEGFEDLFAKDDDGGEDARNKQLLLSFSY